MAARIKVKEEVEVIRCNGDLSVNSMTIFKSKVKKLMDKNQRKVVLDLGKANQVDLAGLGLLVEKIRQVRSVKGDIKLCNVSSSVKDAFRIVGVSKLIEFYDTEVDALRSFKVA